MRLPEGTHHSPLKARLIINRDQPAAPRPSLAVEKLLRGVPFEVEPGGTAEVTLAADTDPLLVTALNPALQERLAHSQATGQAVQLPPLAWSVSGSAGATVTPASEPLPVTGLYSTSLLPSGTAGALHYVELRLGAKVLGRSAPMRVAAGQACAAQVEGALRELPADGTSAHSVRIFDVKDCFGNPVPDGRAVTWEMLPPGAIIGPPGSSGAALLPGTLRHSTTYLTNGASVNEYVAGSEPGFVRFGAHVDERVTKEFVVTQAALDPTLELLLAGEQQRDLSLSVASAAGACAEGTPVEWGVTAGRLAARHTRRPK